MEMILKFGWIFLVLMVIPSIHCSTEKPVVFCDDMIGKYTALAGNLVLGSYEFPIMSSTTGGSITSLSDNNIPKLMHPCFSLSYVNNYKNLMFDIFKHGEFATTVCERQCAHFVDAARFECGDRRPPPSWLTGSVIGAKRKINCSDWALPLTEKGVKDGISLTFTYGTYASGDGKDLTPPFTLDEKSMEYLDGMFIKGLHIRPMVDPAKEAESMSDIESMFESFTQRHPEIIHLAFGNQITFFGDTYRNQSKYIAPRFIPTSKFWTILSNVPALKSLSLAVIEITGQESIPANMTRNLQAIGFYNVSMKSIPSWIQTELLQFLEFSVTLSDETDISGLDNLSGLEHFILTESNLSNIKSKFLAKSSKLLSLTLQCNAISSIAAGAFDHLTQLKFLNLAGNRLVSLPENLLINLNNLVTLDLKSLDNSSNTIQTYNEMTMQCQANLKTPATRLILDAMPKVPTPTNLMALDIRGQENFLKKNRQLLGDFKNLEILNLGNLGLTSIQNMSLEGLCNLNDLNLVGNPLSDKEWLGEDIFVNLNLQRIRMGSPKSMTSVPDSLIAFMRTASQIMFSTPISLNSVDLYRYKIGCDYDTISTATVFGYQIKNSSCESYVEAAIDKIRTQSSKYLSCLSTLTRVSAGLKRLGILKKEEKKLGSWEKIDCNWDKKLNGSRGTEIFWNLYEMIPSKILTLKQTFSLIFSKHLFRFTRHFRRFQKFFEFF
ncbi:hypothetical protein CRE_01628 [Caenorhabditis remanei]|uniref:Uncharacterized protein n=1 Tax=Caenorhabditis remanei TaxID=31234 RepID=E3LGV2_CAERE|nr:hypothetical protein CRE_01628 [Caenorhabditis remanei]